MNRNEANGRHSGAYNESSFPDELTAILGPDLTGCVDQVMNAYPHISAILDHNRKIILSNQHLVNAAGLENLQQIVQERIGDVMNCIHHDEKNGCGLSDSCRLCNIVNTIIESQVKKRKVSRECRVTTRSEGMLIFHDFQVTCSPLLLKNQHFTLLNLVDISSEKRNQMLENLFFHDILNRLGGLSGLIQMIKAENTQAELTEYLDVLDTIGELVIEDIQIQRFLKAAENANLILNIRELSTREIVESVTKQISFNPVMKSRKIIPCDECEDFRIKTDSALLKRILLNMAKNAAEAIEDDGTISISCKKAGHTAVFRVHNEGVIPEHVRYQIFQRSFSTKGHGRGLGTYSMKLFGENYLKGNVYFTSSEERGTNFIIEIPIQLDLPAYQAVVEA